MNKRLYLVWYSYKTNEYLLIGYLDKTEKKYYYRTTKEALKAQELGCILPIPYNDGEVIEFDNLPSFFKNRVLNDERSDQGLPKMDDFLYLVSTKGEIISDSFLTLSETDFQELQVRKI